MDKPSPCWQIWEQSAGGLTYIWRERNTKPKAGAPLLQYSTARSCKKSCCCWWTGHHSLGRGFGGMLVVLNILGGGSWPWPVFSLVWGCVCVSAFVCFCVFYRGETCRWWQKGCEAEWSLVVNGHLLDLRPRSIAGNTSLGLRRLLSFSPFLGCWHFSEAESGQLLDPCVTYWPIFQRPRCCYHDEDLGKGGSKEGKKYVRQGQGGKFYTEEEQDKTMRTKTWGRDPPLKDRI